MRIILSAIITASLMVSCSKINERKPETFIAKPEVSNKESAHAKRETKEDLYNNRHASQIRHISSGPNYSAKLAN
jgi:hypothetical protein